MTLRYWCNALSYETNVELVTTLVSSGITSYSSITSLTCKLEQLNQNLFVPLFNDSPCDKVMIHIGRLSGILIWYFSTQSVSPEDLF